MSEGALRYDSAPRRFRKKPVVIEAIRYEGTLQSARAISKWANEDVPDEGGLLFDYEVAGTNVLNPSCVTLEGEMRVSDGDWVIRGVQGEIYPCKPDIFEATYEEVTS